MCCCCCTDRYLVQSFSCLQVDNACKWEKERWKRNETKNRNADRQKNKDNWSSEICRGKTLERMTTLRRKKNKVRYWCNERPEFLISKWICNITFVVLAVRLKSWFVNFVSITLLTYILYRWKWAKIVTISIIKKNFKIYLRFSPNRAIF